MNAIELRNISVVYPNPKGDDRIALSDFSISASNEMLALLGPNGSGKSTLMSVISRTIIPGSGQVLAPTSRKDLSVVFQTPALDLLLTISENLMLAGALHNLSKSQTKSRITSICDELGLSDRLDDQVRHLSGGLARRADLARALIPHPRVLLLDEPTTGLDIDARRIFWDTLDRIRTRLTMTVLVATHITEEAEHADRVLMLRQGQTVQLGSPVSLKSAMGDRIIRVRVESQSDIDPVCNWLTQHAINHIVSDRLILGTNANSSLASSCPIESASITLAPPTLADVYTFHAQSPVTASMQGDLT